MDNVRIQVSLFVVALTVWLGACTPFPYRTWAEPRPLMASDAEVGNWEQIFGKMGQVAVDNRIADTFDEDARNSGEPLDEGTQRWIEEARAYILAKATCPQCLYWDMTLENVRALGRTIRVSRSHRRGLRASYFFYTDVVKVRPEAIADHTLVQLAAILVHELTHRSEFLALRERTQFTRDELLFLLLVCDDYARRHKLADEIVAYRNQVAWTLAAVPSWQTGFGRLAWLSENEPSIDDSGYIWLLGSLSRDMSERRSIGLYGMAWEETDRYGREFGSRLLEDFKPRPLVCGPPAIIRGPSRGRYEDPAFYDPEISVPFLCANGFCP